MSNGFLSQEEIDSLLKGGSTPKTAQNIESLDSINSMEKDLLGEIGNISMGSAATALSQIINQSVSITTPVVSVTTLGALKKEFQIPNIVLEVEYVSGITGRNILAMKVSDASIIANLMMGGDGSNASEELTEIEISAVQEAMNQMIGSAATSMSTMFSRGINISPPISRIWRDSSDPLSEDIGENEPIVRVSFSMDIGELVHSSIMQLLPISTAKKIVGIMLGSDEEKKPSRKEEAPRILEEKPQISPDIREKEIESSMEKVDVHTATFEPLNEAPVYPVGKNIDLILDVPLEISVVLGRTRKTIKEVLSLGNGSLIELDKLAEEPVEILVNGKKVAYGEVVVVDESFGVRITSIISNIERVKSLKD